LSEPIRSFETVCGKRADAIEQAKPMRAKSASADLQTYIEWAWAHALERITVEDNGVGINPEKMNRCCSRSGVPKNCTWR